MANGFQQESCFRALDHQGIDIQKLDVREQTATVFLAQVKVCIFVGISMPSNQTSMKQTPSSCSIGNGQRYAAQGTFVGINSLLFGFVIYLVVLRCLWQVELFDVLSEARREVADQEIRLLNGFLGIHHVVLHLRTNDGVSQTGWRWVGSSRRAPIGFRIMASEKVIEHVAGVSQ